MESNAGSENRFSKLAVAVTEENPGRSAGIVRLLLRFTPLGHFGGENVQVSISVDVRHLQAVTVHHVPLEQVVPMVSSKCAAMLGMQDEIGTLKPGVDADVSIVADETGRFLLEDNEGTKVVAEHYIRPVFCLRAGRRVDADSPILPKPLLAAAA